MAVEFLAFEAAAGLLKAGGVLILGTDTLPGFHCRADLAAAVGRILELKGRESDKSLLVLAGSVEQATGVAGTLDERQTEFCQQCWPGPFSLILPSGGGMTSAAIAPGGTVAVRVPALASLRSLILAVGSPLVSTSVNRAGEAPLDNLDSACSVFGGGVDGFWAPSESLLVPPVSGPVRPSALIDLTVWPPAMLRSGPLDPPGGEPGVS